MLFDRQKLLNFDKKSIPIEEKTSNITVPIGVNMGREELVLKHHQLQISSHRLSSCLISNLALTLLGLAILVVFSHKGNAHIGFNAMHKKQHAICFLLNRSFQPESNSIYLVLKNSSIPWTQASVILSQICQRKKQLWEQDTEKFCTCCLSWKHQKD